ncbi:MAG: hypothetical protein CUN56_00505 [Phototrophicales bacterium]|nr:MAG: hypothetical protein CUN56_00505 [Phototrophicales bacterium]
MSVLGLTEQNITNLYSPAAFTPSYFGDVAKASFFESAYRTGFQLLPLMSLIDTVVDNEKKKSILDKNVDVIQGAAEDISVRSGFLGSVLDARESVLRERKAVYENYEDVIARAPAGVGTFIASMLGGIGGAFTDPVNLATLPFGATAATSAFRAIGVEAALNAAIEAAESPFVMSFAKEAGVPYTVSDALKDIAFAGAGAGVITGALRGAGAASRAVLDKLGSVPAHEATSLRVHKLTEAAKDAVDDIDVHDALFVAERNLSIAKDIPLSRVNEGDILEHFRVMDSVQRSISERRPIEIDLPQRVIESDIGGIDFGRVRYTDDAVIIPRDSDVIPSSLYVSKADIEDMAVSGLISRQESSVAISSIDTTRDLVGKLIESANRVKRERVEYDKLEKRLKKSIDAGYDVGSRRKGVRTDKDVAAETLAALEKRVADKRVSLNRAINEAATVRSRLTDSVNEINDIVNLSKAGARAVVAQDNRYSPVTSGADAISKREAIENAMPDDSRIEAAIEADFMDIVKERGDETIYVDGVKMTIAEVADDIESDRNIIKAMEACAVK